jgi:serine/threonine protein kinase
MIHDDLPTSSLSPSERVEIDRRGARLIQRMFGAQPRRLGRYALGDRIGEGGMGVVYVAHDVKLRRKVAIKLLSTDHPELRRRFVREAQAMARLSHPNTVEIHEVDEIEDRAFIVMEFIDGVTLREWLHQKARSWHEILAVFVGIGRGLEAAHRRGLVHRDFKPSNVMIDSTGRPRVLDFGVAQLDALNSPDGDCLVDPHESRLTHPGTLIGTPMYMSPEQACCEPIDARSDQFSFCVVLYEALFGVRPFGQGGGDLPRFRPLGPRDLPGTRPQALPAGVDALLLRGLQLSAARRYADMTALLVDLERCLDPDRRTLRPTRVLLGLLAATSIAWLVHRAIEVRDAARIESAFKQVTLATQIDLSVTRVRAKREPALPHELPNLAHELCLYPTRCAFIRDDLHATSDEARTSILAYVARGRPHAPFLLDEPSNHRWVTCRPLSLSETDWTGWLCLTTDDADIELLPTPLD